MQFAIIGLGLFGSKLALELSNAGHEVLVIDNDESHIQEIHNRVTEAIIGDATNEELIEELITSDFAAAVVTITESIEASLLSALNLQKVGVKQIYVKSNQPEHSQILKRMGIKHIIKPEEEAAVKLAKCISSPKVVDLIIYRDELSFLELKSPQKFVGKDLKQLNLRKKYNVQVFGIQQADETEMDITPSPSYRFKPDDLILLAASKESINRFVDKFGN